MRLFALSLDCRSLDSKESKDGIRVSEGVKPIETPGR
jgi:hypothetical protein